ncbi:MAG: hypothetical protein WD757_01535 [Actinomycetota bacterium]
MVDTLERHTGRPPAARKVPESKPQTQTKAGYFWGALRIVIGWTFLWAFFDKLLGLGYSTGVNPETGAITRFGPEAWINGGSPTAGYLEFAPRGVLADFYKAMAGAAWVDWVFMLSLLLIGVALMTGIATRLAAIGGAVWMVVLYSSAMLPEHNPVVDDHVIQFIALLGIAYVGAGRWLGLGRFWAKLPVVRNHAFLQ